MDMVYRKCDYALSVLGKVFVGFTDTDAPKLSLRSRTQQGLFHLISYMAVGLQKIWDPTPPMIFSKIFHADPPPPPT